MPPTGFVNGEPRERPDGARKRLCFEPGFESYSTYSNLIQRNSSLI